MPVFVLVFVLSDEHRIIIEPDTAGVFRAPTSSEGLTISVALQVAAANGTVGQRINVTIPNPRLWSPDDPYLYDIRVRLLVQPSAAPAAAAALATHKALPLSLQVRICSVHEGM